MSFEKGSVALRVFKSSVGMTLPEDVVDRLKQQSVPPLDLITNEGFIGWATGRHILDNNITEETVVISGRVRATLVKGEKKIPGALFKAECKQEELALMDARGTTYLKRADKAEIAKSVKDRMLPDMPPTLASIDMVSNKDGCYATAMSDSQVDLLTSSWNRAIGYSIYPYTPTVAAQLLCNFDTRALEPTSFSSEVADGKVEQDIGTEFLTWLWYFSETTDGMNDNFAFALDGPFTFIHEGLGAHEIVVRKGNPGISQEAKAALLAGKKLKKAKLTVAQGNTAWTCSMDAYSWAFGSLKMPKSEESFDPISSFEERMISIGTFVGAIESLFKKFMAIRVSQEQWDNEVAGIRKWVSDRVSMA